MIVTDRLILRPWKEDDREPFFRMNSDPAVMQFLPKCLSRAESDALVDRIHSHFQKHSFGLYAVNRRNGPSFIGFIGLSVPAFQAHFTPCVEIGWRLAADQWGRGLATEGATAILRYAFDELNLPEVVSFTVPANVASRRVMEKIGMRHDSAGDFDHPSLPEGSPLRRHVLYRVQNPASREL